MNQTGPNGAAMTAGYLGIDVGGTKVALRHESGERHRTHTFQWAPGDAARDVAALADAVRALRAEATDNLAAVGVALPATLDPAGRVTAWPSRPSWTGLDLAAELGALFPGIPVVCADDGDLAALAEAHNLSCPDLVYVGVGTGIGGGAVLGGQPVPGPTRGSWEIGHLIIDRGGPECVCGRRGCVQAVASGPAVLRRAGGVDFATLRAEWLAGADRAVHAVDDACAAVATALVSVAELVHPQVAVIGGGFADGLPGFVEAVARHMAALARPGHPAPPVREAGLGGLSSLHGAVLLARGAG
jgi:kanosamine 6-kinase